MSRCFPYPPPGFEWKPRTDQVELLSKEKHKEKKHKKEKKDKDKREHRDKREKDKDRHKHKDKKERREKHKHKKDKDKDRDREREKEKDKNRDVPEDSRFLDDLVRRISDEANAGPATQISQKPLFTNPNPNPDTKPNHVTGFPERKLMGICTDRGGIEGKKVTHNQVTNPNRNRNPNPNFTGLTERRVGVGLNVSPSEVKRSVAKPIIPVQRKNNGLDPNPNPSLTVFPERRVVNAAPRGKNDAGPSSLSASPNATNPNPSIIGSAEKRVRGKSNSPSIQRNNNGLEQKISGNSIAPNPNFTVLNGPILESNKKEKRKEREEKREKDRDSHREEKKRKKEKDKEKKDKDKHKHKDKNKEKEKEKEKEREKEKLREGISANVAKPLPNNNNNDKVNNGRVLGMGENLKKQNEFWANGFLHEDEVRAHKLPLEPQKRKEIVANGFIPAIVDHSVGPTKQINKLPSQPPLENGRTQLRESLPPTTGTTTTNTTINTTNSSCGKTELPLVKKDHRINGVITEKPKENKNGESSSKRREKDRERKEEPPHPDLKYLSVVYSVPQMEEWIDESDGQDWLFKTSLTESNSNPRVERPNPKIEPVWDKAVRIDPVETLALPYVIPL